MFKAEAFIEYQWKEVYPEFWIMSNSSDLSDYLHQTPLNKIKLRCIECKKEVHICALGDGLKKEPYFAHNKTDKDEIILDCSLRTENEDYQEIFKFDKPRANTFESVLHKEMKKFAVTKFWSKENKYIVIKEEDVLTYNRFENTKFRSDLLVQPIYEHGQGRLQRHEQYVFEGQTNKNPLTVKHIEKAIEYKKVGFLEENIINAYSLDHLNRATFISDNYIDVMKLKEQGRTVLEDKISKNKETRGSIIDMLELTAVEKLSGYYAFHADTEFLFALKNYSNNQLLFMHIPITEYRNPKGEKLIELEEKNRHKRKLILASVLDTITIKGDYCVIAYLYFNDITNISDISEYNNRVEMHKNKTIEFCQKSLNDLYERYIYDIDAIRNECEIRLDEVKKENKVLNDENIKITRNIDVVSQKSENIREQLVRTETKARETLEIKEKEIEKLEKDNILLSKEVAKTSKEISESVHLKLEEELVKEYKKIEPIKQEYNRKYEDLKVQVEKEVKETLEKDYKDRYLSLTDGHTNMSKRLACEKIHRKYLLSIKNIEQATIEEKIKCPKIEKLSLVQYMREYETVQTYGCGACKL